MIHSEQTDSNNGTDELPFFLLARQPSPRREGPSGWWRVALAGELHGGLNGDAADDFHPDLIKGQDFFSQSRARHKAGHAPDDAAGLVLNDDRSAGSAKGFAS